MNNRLWIVFVVLVVAALGGLIFLKKNDTPKTNADSYDVNKLLTIDDVGKGKIPDHFIGNKDSKVIVIAYEDFACVHCAQLASTFSKIIDDYKDRILFIYRHFSLGYPNSIVTQSAAEAAYLLGGEEAFWKMHKLLFQDDTTWTGQAVPSDSRKELLSGFAREVGLNVDEFLKKIEDYRSNGISSKMNRDKTMGTKAGVTGTPTWFINGQKPSELNDSTIRKAIDDALKSTEKKTNKN